MTDPAATSDDIAIPATVEQQQSTQDTAVGTGVSPRQWRWKTLDAATMAAIRRRVATWPTPSSAQINAVAALRTTPRPAESPTAPDDDHPAQRCA